MLETQPGKDGGATVVRFLCAEHGDFLEAGPRSWQLTCIPRTVPELLFSTEIRVTMTTLLWLLVKVNLRTATSSWHAYLQCKYIALAFSFSRDYISSGDFQKDFQLSTCKGIKNKHMEEANCFPEWKVLIFCTHRCRIRILSLPKGCSLLGLGSPVQEIRT